MPTSRKTLSCVLVGSESLLIQCGEILRERGQELCAVVTRESQIIDWATKAGIPTLAPGKGLAEELRAFEFDYLFSVTNLALLSDEVLNLPKRGAINFHDGPLPRYAGMYAPVWALLEGEREYGISFHEMTSGTDEGDLWVQRFFPISPEETSLTLNTHCYEAAIDAFAELIDGLSSGSATKTPQDLSKRSYFARYQRPAGAGVLDWTRSAESLVRAVRAMDFGQYENAFAAPKIIHSGRVCLVRNARVETLDSPAQPGTLVRIGDDEWCVACANNEAIAVSNFSCVMGNAMTPDEAATRLGLAVGQLISGFTPAALDRVSERCDEATPAEAFWVARLARLDSIEMPYTQSRSEAGSTSQPGSVDLRIDAKLRHFHSSDSNEAASALIAGFATYLARVSGRDGFDLSFSEDRLDQLLEGTGEMFSGWQPLRIATALGVPVGKALEGTVRSIGRIRERGCFLSDVVARYPRLSSNATLISGATTAVAVGIHEDLDAYSLRQGADFAFVVTPDGEGVRLVHDQRVLSHEAVTKIAGQLEIFLAALSEPDLEVAKVPLVDETRRREILEDWNDTCVEFDRSQTIHALFEAQVGLRPDEPAVAFEGVSLTYRELSERANQLAHHLIGLGTVTDKLVGIYLERSIDMLVSVLAVLKAGGAYVPLDPTYPGDRIEYMIQDSKANVVLTQDALIEALPGGDAIVVAVDRDATEISNRPVSSPEISCSPGQLAYVIYTSGSTGKPKGVMVEHRNAVNFFVGMDERIPHDPAGVWLAVTSLSFDISVLELLWTLTRGFKVVVHADRQRSVEAEETIELPWRPIDFGLALWGSDAGPGPRKYELMLESAKFGDSHGFKSVMTPERHFGAFGGPFPNPAVTSAAIAAVTERIEIRAGSCVLPLHHPVRVAEEWAVVDNISGGRVGVAFAAGWQPNDFVIRPEAHAEAKKNMFESAEAVKRLWRGEAVEFISPTGEMVPTSTLPRPVQSELPIWMTTAGNVDTFRAAGEGGFHVLTHLLGQTLEELAEKIKVYRRGRVAAGLDPKTGIVTCMLHTYVGTDNDAVRELVRQPMKDYLASAMKLVMGFAWTFPAFARPGGPDSKPEDVDLSSLTEEETDAILEFAFERYYETSGLFGTPEICAQMVERVKAADIDEIASLIDFGLPNDIALAGLEFLDRVRSEANVRPESAEAFDATVVDQFSLSAQIETHSVTHLQCTPSHATMLLTDLDTMGALSRVPHLMIGGEAFPISLAAELDSAGCHDVTNMYGPTETTIWSSTEAVRGRPESISIGRPIANTQFYILGAGQEPLPVGIAGELLIGGEGVVRGYHDRPDLTADRFIPDPFSDRPDARLYRTGDLARWREDGTIDFLGRLDHQVKIRGYRIELGEIEARLAGLPGLREAVVIAREDTPGDHRLVAYLIAEMSPVPEDAMRSGLRENLPEFMLPSAFVFLDQYPQTPNGKIDRKALPAPNQVKTASAVEYQPPSNELEGLIAEVWKEVLYLEQAGVDDNFFDLGGHSLLVVQAHRKLREVSPRPVSLTDLYRFPTIRGLAGHLSSEGDDGEQVKKSQARGEKRRQALGRRRRR